MTQSCDRRATNYEKLDILVKYRIALIVHAKIKSLKIFFILSQLKAKMHQLVSEFYFCKQLAHFRDIYETAANETAGYHLLENHRPVQDLHSRKVTTNDIKSGISIITSSLVTLLGSITIVLFL